NGETIPSDPAVVTNREKALHRAAAQRCRASASRHFRQGRPDLVPGVQTQRSGYSFCMQLQTSGIGSERVARAAGEAVAALEEARIPYVLIGGLASSILGRPRSTEDVDLLVKKQDATRVLDALAGVGFQTERTNPLWIFKARKHGVVIDVIFWL